MPPRGPTGTTRRSKQQGVQSHADRSNPTGRPGARRVGGPARRRCAGAEPALLVDPGQPGRGSPGDARRGAGRLRGRGRLPVLRSRPVPDPHPGGAAGRSGHDRGRRHAARRLRGAARRLRRSRPARARSRRGAAAADGARPARHGRAEVRALDAGDLHHGRQQAGPRVPARGRRHQRAHLRPAHRMVEGDGRGDRRPEVRLPRRSGGAQAPLLPGLPAARLHRLDGDRVPLGRRGRGLGEVQGALAVHEPGLAELQLHAGAADHRRRLGRLRPHRPPRRGVQPEARRLRRLPGAGRAGGPRLHAGDRGHGDPAHGARSGGLDRADQLHAAAGDPGRDAARRPTSSR